MRRLTIATWASLLAVVSACDESPVISGTSVLTNTFDVLGPYRVHTAIIDRDGVSRVYLYWRQFDRGGDAESAEFRPHTMSGEDTIYEGEIPGTQVPERTVEYYVQAEDAAVVVQDPPVGVFSFDVLRRYAKCESATDCGPGEVCDEAFCSPAAVSCQGETDCPSGFVCDAGGRCRPAVRACAEDRSCLISEICVDGQCETRPTCVNDAACPEGFTCHESVGACVRSCSGAIGCPAELSCQLGVCVSPVACETSEDCVGTEECDLDAVCREPGAGPCSPCGSDADCGGPTDYCLYDPKRDELRCGSDCSTEPCPEGMSCEVVADPPQCVPTEACQARALVSAFHAA